MKAVTSGVTLFLVRVIAFPFPITGCTSHISSSTVPVTRGEGRWAIAESGLQLADSTGQIMKSIHAVSLPETGPLTPPGKFAIVGGGGRFVLVFSNDVPEGQGSTLELYDALGERKWKYDRVGYARKIRSSDDGTRTLFVQYTHVLAPGFDQPPDDYSESVVVADDHGRELRRIGPFELIQAVFISRNGRFGMVTEPEGYHIANLRSGRIRFVPNEEMTSEELRLLETGEVVENPLSPHPRTVRPPD